MKTLILLLLTVISYGQQFPMVQQEIIVKFKKNIVNSNEVENAFLTEPDLLNLDSKINVSAYKPIINKRSKSTIVISFSADFNVNDVVSMYEKTNLFEYAEPNYIAESAGVLDTTPDDSQYFKQWGLKNDGSFSGEAIAGADISMEPAWDIETGDPNMIVAIIDTGTRFTHPEFSGRIWNNVNEVADGTDTDNNGFVDDLIAGWDFVNTDNDPSDDHGHGTNVAGIALATGNNTTGFAGVNWNSKLMVCKVLASNGNGSYANMAAGIYYAVDNGAKVINMSIGGTANSATLNNAVDYCYDNGVVLVACMMNNNVSTNYYPAAHDKSIAVGSTDFDDTRSAPFFWSSTSGSNFGSHIDLVAPGNYIYSLSYNSDTTYNTYWGGTSQSAPLVAGVVSLLFAQNPSLTFEEIRTILRATADDQVGDPSEDINGFDIYYGYGRLNAHNALTYAALHTDNFNDENINLSLFPNPANLKLPLTFSNLEVGTYEITIYNTLGEKVYKTTERTDNQLEINVLISKLVTGTYFLRLQNSVTRRITNKKIIVK